MSVNKRAEPASGFQLAAVPTSTGKGRMASPAALPASSSPAATCLGRKGTSNASASHAQTIYSQPGPCVLQLFLTGTQQPLPSYILIHSVNIFSTIIFPHQNFTCCILQRIRCYSLSTPPPITAVCGQALIYVSGGGMRSRESRQ